jgi:hypothetical protein
LSATVLQFLDTTAKRETSSNGRSLARKEKSGSKTSSTRVSKTFSSFVDRIQMKAQDCCALAGVGLACFKTKIPKKKKTTQPGRNG